MADKIIKITQEGLEKLKKEYDELVNVRREEIKRDLEYARSLGDLSENADYDAAREAQRVNEEKIKELKYKIDNHEIISKSDANEGIVVVGSTVVLEVHKKGSTKKVEYQILGEDDSDLENNVISSSSPLAKSILGKGIGEKAKVECKNSYDVVVKEIK